VSTGHRVVNARMLTVYDAVLQVVSQTDAQKTTFENVSVA